ncbi:PHP domain-containing protein [Halobacteriales archaeon Cl-PHB]
MVVADLHVHTTTSDGTMDPAEVPAAARAAGLEAVAVTDHDRLNAALGGPVVERDGVTVVHGIELRVEAGDQRLDLLGYGVRPTDELTATIERVQQDRLGRGRAIVEDLEAHLGVELEVAIETGLGRPDIARAVAAHPETNYTVEEVFEEFIGDERPLYHSREIPDFDRGRRLLSDACDLVGLAHPLRYDDPVAALEFAADLDAVERHYPYGQDVDPAPVDRAIDRHDLLATGGSDAHDDALGLAGLDAAAWDRVRDRLSGPS